MVEIRVMPNRGRDIGPFLTGFTPYFHRINRQKNFAQAIVKGDENAGGILKQRFEPTPSPDVCRFCDYRIICPAAEK